MTALVERLRAATEGDKGTMLSALPGYPFFPCKICQREGYSGKDNDGCDHTVFERARAMHPGLKSEARTALSALQSDGEGK